MKKDLYKNYSKDEQSLQNKNQRSITQPTKNKQNLYPKLFQRASFHPDTLNHHDIMHLHSLIGNRVMERTMSLFGCSSWLR